MKLSNPTTTMCAALVCVFGLASGCGSDDGGGGDNGQGQTDEADGDGGTSGSGGANDDDDRNSGSSGSGDDDESGGSSSDDADSDDDSADGNDGEPGSSADDGADGPSPDLGDESGPGAIPDGANPGGVEVMCDATEPGISPLVKLSTVQYRNTVRDLLTVSGAGQIVGEVEDALSSVPDDSLGDSFRGLDGRISLELVQGYLDVGIAASNAVQGNPDALEALAGECALDEDLSEGCATEFLTQFLTRAYRRPPSDDDLSEYLELNDGARTPAEAIGAMLVVALSSPRFVNVVEIDGTASQSSGDVLQLTSFEIASRLSYTFWQTMPDDELLEAASDGSLATEDGYEAQLSRVFDDPRTRQTVWQFWNEWLKLEKFTGFESSRPGFRSLAEGTNLGEEGHDYYADMVSEVRDLTDVLTFSTQGTIADLLTTDLSVTTSEDLAALYGVEVYTGDGDYPRMPEGTRAGLFQRAAMLATSLEQTNPFHRGAFVRRHVLCDALPQPDPNDLPPGALDPPPLEENQTTRERFQAKVEGQALCEGCHATFSDIGYVLESFDALGRHRTVERVFDEQNGDLLAELPIDTSGVARVDISDETPIANAVELTQRMVDSQKVEACLAQNYFGYALRRIAESESGDACVVQDLAELLRTPDEGLAGAFQRIAQHESFFLRKVGPR